MNSKYKKLFVWLVAAGLIMTACRKDNSTLDANKIAGITIDTTGAGAFNVYQFEHLVVKPKVITSLPESDLSYSWRINLKPGDTVWQELSNTRDLDAEIRFRPNAINQFHTLYYTVTEKNTGLQYIMNWRVTVLNNIGEGLVIAETKDNSNSDISHIMAPEVTTSFNTVNVKHHVYSSINGSTISGVVKQLRFCNIFGVNALLGITPNSVFRVNTIDYTLFGKNDDLFAAPPGNYQSQALGYIFQHEVYIGNGKMTATNLVGNRKWGAPLDFKYVIPDHVAMNANNGQTNSYQPPIRFNFYDETNGYFVWLASAQFGDTKMHEYASNTTAPFNPASLPNKVNLAAGISPDRGFLHILKDKTSGKVELYIFDAGVEASPSPVAPAPVALFDLSAAPDIGNATKFVLPDNQKVLYYATANKIYAVLYGASSPVFEERYTLPAGEQLTTLQIYQQAGYPLNTTYIGTHNKQLVLSTWNGTEGKVHLLPMINPGLGTIDVPNIKTFGGFDKITAITPQK